MPAHPRARQNRVSFESQMPTMTPRSVFVHTNGGGTGPPGVGLTQWFDTLWSNPADGVAGQGIGSTFQVFNDGEFDQLVDSTRVIFAQFQASRWSGAIETEDDGNPGRPWTEQQIDALVDILTWYAKVHHVPMRLMANPTDSGIGYHQQFSEWNGDGHDCPGSVRVQQLLQVVIPRCQAGPLPAAVDPVIAQLPTIPPADQTHGRFVHLARTALADQGWPMAASSVNDQAFDLAVKFVQGASHLTADGILGPATWPAVLAIGKSLPTIQPGDQTHARFVHLARVALADAGWPMPLSFANDQAFNYGLHVVQGWAGLKATGVLDETSWPAVLKIGNYARKAIPA